ncbi:MAG: hypothetical protein R3C68_09400 [Myxococcota bacterium]
MPEANVAVVISGTGSVREHVQRWDVFCGRERVSRRYFTNWWPPIPPKFIPVSVDEHNAATDHVRVRRKGDELKLVGLNQGAREQLTTSQGSFSALPKNPSISAAVILRTPVLTLRYRPRM